MDVKIVSPTLLLVEMLTLGMKLSIYSVPNLALAGNEILALQNCVEHCLQSGQLHQLHQSNCPMVWNVRDH